jgi:hypothetical protein
MKITFLNQREAAKAHLALLQDEITIDLGAPYCVIRGHARDGKVSLLILPQAPVPIAPARPPAP